MNIHHVSLLRFVSTMFLVTIFFATNCPISSAQETITFDGSNLKEGDPVTDQFDGVSFERAIFVLPGKPELAFNASNFQFLDEVIDNESDFDGPFITVNEVPGTLTVIFEEPVNSVNFLAADLDLSDVLAVVGLGINDEFLGVIAISDDFSGTGDGIAKLVELPWSSIGRLEIRVENSFGGGRWGFDTLRYVISVLLGDVNLDGCVDLLDVQPFVDLITSGKFQAEADINGDGVVDLLDVAPFVGLLTEA